MGGVAASTRRTDGDVTMKLLLTSNGVVNPSIRDALEALLGKPIAESNALFIPTAIYPFAGGPYMAADAISGERSARLCQLGWKSWGVLELTALPSIERAAWVPTVEQADALLFWGGDPLFLSGWMRESGLTDLLASLQSAPVYVGVSAGSIAASATFGETYYDPPSNNQATFECSDIVFESPQGQITRTLVAARGAGFVDFAIIPHLDHPDHEDASLTNAETWAAKLPVPVYAIDDQTAVQVNDGVIDVISEGHWKLFQPTTL
jgi:dipeptidase E